MVTLRRDVAVMQNNSIFDRVDRDQITDYDVFMQAKNNEKKQRFFSSSDNCESEKKEELIIHREVFNDNIKDNDYDLYMLSQINRTSPQKILSKQEFENKKKGRSLRKIYGKEKDKLSKKGKLFVGLYTLILLSASIALAII